MTDIQSDDYQEFTLLFLGDPTVVEGMKMTKCGWLVLAVKDCFVCQANDGKRRMEVRARSSPRRDTVSCCVFMWVVTMIINNEGFVNACMNPFSWKKYKLWKESFVDLSLARGWDEMKCDIGKVRFHQRNCPFAEWGWPWMGYQKVLSKAQNTGIVNGRLLLTLY